MSGSIRTLAFLIFGFILGCLAVVALRAIPQERVEFVYGVSELSFNAEEINAVNAKVGDAVRETQASARCFVVLHANGSAELRFFNIRGMHDVSEAARAAAIEALRKIANETEATRMRQP